MPTASVSTDADHLVRRHLDLAHRVVAEIAHRVPRHVSRDDLVSAADLALVIAARDFDGGRGVPFARYAAVRIRGAVLDELRSLDWASRRVRQRARAIDRTRADLAPALGRTATRDDVAHELGISRAEVEAAEADARRAAVVSLHTLDEDSLSSAVDASTPEATLLWQERIGYLHHALAELPPPLRKVVHDRYFARRPVADIAADLGVTEACVCRMRARALAMMREAVRSAEGQEASLPARRVATERRAG